MNQNLYTVLGLVPDVDEAEIRASFRQLAKAFHPDVSGGDSWSEQQFKAVHHAYRILSDPKKRAAYDAELASAHARARRRLRQAAITAAAAFAVTIGSAAVMVLPGGIGSQQDPEVGPPNQQSTREESQAKPLALPHLADGWRDLFGKHASLSPAPKDPPRHSEPSRHPVTEDVVGKSASVSSGSDEQPPQPGLSAVPSGDRLQFERPEPILPDEPKVPSAVLSPTEEITDYVLRVFLRDRERFAERVEFYNQGMLDRDVVMRSKALYARRWPRRTYTLIPGSLDLRATGPERFEVRFAYQYVVGNEHTRAAGVARTKVGLLRSGREFLVTAVQENVQRR
jgi:curved DNA-binding protein CbpA